MSYNTCTFITLPDTDLFTVVCLPNNTDTFPTVLMRSPYVSYAEKMTDEEAIEKVVTMHQSFIDNGYAVVYQHNTVGAVGMSVFIGGTAVGCPTGVTHAAGTV